MRLIMSYYLNPTLNPTYVHVQPHALTDFIDLWRCFGARSSLAN